LVESIPTDAFKSGWYVYCEAATLYAIVLTPFDASDLLQKASFGSEFPSQRNILESCIMDAVQQHMRLLDDLLVGSFILGYEIEALFQQSPVIIDRIWRVALGSSLQISAFSLESAKHLFLGKISVVEFYQLLADLTKYAIFHSQ